MTRKTLLILALSAAPLAFAGAASATPAVGDIVGTNPDAAKAALLEKGCAVDEFEAEDGKIEAKCKDAETGKALEVYIDPATGAVTEVKNEED